MAQEIKIHLATYLKDAGIKATEKQVDQLAKRLQTTSKQMTSAAKENLGELGQIEGAFGKIQKAVGGTFGKVMSFFAAFKVGWDIGDSIYKDVITPLFGIKDPIEELKKENRNLKKEAEAAAQAWQDTITTWERGWSAEVKACDDAKNKIEELTAAYLRMQKAKERVQAAEDDAQVLDLEREKYNMMSTSQTPDEAASWGKYYDVLIAVEQSEQKIAKFDREAATAKEKVTAAEEAHLKSIDKVSRLKQQLKEADKKLAFSQTQEAADTFGLDAAVREEKAMQAKRDRIAAQLEAAEKDERRRRSDLEASKVENGAMEQEKKNIYDRAELEVEEKRKAYDEFMDELDRKNKAQAKAQAEEDKRTRLENERRLAAERISNLRSELAERQRAEQDAQSWQAQAESRLSAAWGLYRNQDQMQAVIDEKKAQEAAEKQWEKDFQRLKSRRRDWRTAEMGTLSAAEESVRQVALAKEEKSAADKAVIETAENTRDMAEKLDELLTMKGGE